MKNLILFLAALLLAPLADAQAAGPYVVWDVTSSAADTCTFTFPSGAAAVDAAVAVDAVNGVPANGNRVCKLDVSSAAVGANVAQVQLKSNVWGTLGVASSFPFTRPTVADLAVGSGRLVK